MKKESIRNAAERIEQYLRVAKTVSMKTLCSAFDTLPPKNFYAAIGWLLREGTILVENDNVTFCTESECNYPFYF